MSDPVHCDHCGKLGYRRRHYPCPEGWLFLEAVDESDPHHTLIVWSCSLGCAIGQWRAGPGPRMQTDLPEIPNDLLRSGNEEPEKAS